MNKINLDKAEGMVATVRKFTDTGVLETKALVLEVLSTAAVRVQPLFGAPFVVPKMTITNLQRPDKVWKERSKVYVDITGRGLELDDEQVAVLERLDVPTVGLVETDDHSDPENVKTLIPGAFSIGH